MASDKDDASTDIDSLARKLAAKMTDVAEKLQDERTKAGEKKASKDKGKKEYPIPEVTFSASTKGVGAFRTPAEQAKTIADNASWVCWGAHMADKARDISIVTKPKIPNGILELVFREKFKEFKAAWIKERNALGLKDASGGDGWVEKDPLHVEMADSKIDPGDKRADACMEEYVKLTRGKGKVITNKRFEKDNEKRIQKIEKKLNLSAD